MALLLLFCDANQVGSRRKPSLLVYLDARGEQDLRAPGGWSSVNWRHQNPERLGHHTMVVAGQWSNAEVEIPGHFKGHLTFVPHLLAEIPVTDLTFSYANRFHYLGDYSTVCLKYIETVSNISIA